MNKNIIPFILMVALTSCSVFAPKPTQTPVPTVTRLPTSTSTPEPTPFFEISTAIIPTPIPTPYFTFEVNRTDPESVIRAWFDALVRKDGVAMASVDGTVPGRTYFFGNYINSIEILEMKPLSESSGDLYHYRVLFNEQGFRDGVKYKEQRLWTFDLTWDDGRQSLIVYNHGAG